MNIYLLKFINDPMIRKNVRRALNRGEAYHKLRNDKLIEALKYISPVAWININLYGFYTFEQEQPTQIDMARLAESINMMKAA